MSNLKLHCPECGSHYWVEASEGSWPHCDYCGFTQYDEDTLALQTEVLREQAECKRRFGKILPYREWEERR